MGMEFLESDFAQIEHVNQVLHNNQQHKSYECFSVHELLKYHPEMGHYSPLGPHKSYLAIDKSSTATTFRDEDISSIDKIRYNSLIVSVRRYLFDDSTGIEGVSYHKYYNHMCWEYTFEVYNTLWDGGWILSTPNVDTGEYVELDKDYVDVRIGQDPDDTEISHEESNILVVRIFNPEEYNAKNPTPLNKELGNNIQACFHMNQAASQRCIEEVKIEIKVPTVITVPVQNKPNEIKITEAPKKKETGNPIVPIVTTTIIKEEEEPKPTVKPTVSAEKFYMNIDNRTVYTHQYDIAVSETAQIKLSNSKKGGKTKENKQNTKVTLLPCDANGKLLSIPSKKPGKYIQKFVKNKVKNKKFDVVYSATSEPGTYYCKLIAESSDPTIKAPAEKIIKVNKVERDFPTIKIAESSLKNVYRGSCHEYTIIFNLKNENKVVTDSKRKEKLLGITVNVIAKKNGKKEYYSTTIKRRKITKKVNGKKKTEWQYYATVVVSYRKFYEKNSYLTVEIPKDQGAWGKRITAKSDNAQTVNHKEDVLITHPWFIAKNYFQLVNQLYYVDGKGNYLDSYNGSKSSKLVPNELGTDFIICDVGTFNIPKPIELFREISIVGATGNVTKTTKKVSYNLSNVNCDTIYLNEGSSGENTTRLQNDLKSMGYYTATVDGSYGPVTKQAVIKLQQKLNSMGHNLYPDGEFGPVTCKAFKQHYHDTTVTTQTYHPVFDGNGNNIFYTVEYKRNFLPRILHINIIGITFKNAECAIKQNAAARLYLHRCVFTGNKHDAQHHKGCSVYMPDDDWSTDNPKHWKTDIDKCYFKNNRGNEIQSTGTTKINRCLFVTTAAEHLQQPEVKVVTVRSGSVTYTNNKSYINTGSRAMPTNHSWAKALAYVDRKGQFNGKGPSQLLANDSLPLYKDPWNNQAYTYAIYYYPYEGVRTEIVCCPIKGRERSATGHASSAKNWCFYDGYQFPLWNKGRNRGNTTDPWTAQELSIPTTIGVFDIKKNKFISNEYDPRISNNRITYSVFEIKGKR